MVCCAKVLYPGFLPFCTVGTLANPHQACNAFVLYHDSLSRLTFMPGTNLLWDGRVNKGFRAELRSSLAWDNQHTIGPISGQHKFKLGHLSSMATKNMLRPYARYLISFIFYIIRSDKAFLWWWRILKMSSLTSSYFGQLGICQLVSLTQTAMR